VINGRPIASKRERERRAPMLKITFCRREVFARYIKICGYFRKLPFPHFYDFLPKKGFWNRIESQLLTHFTSQKLIFGY